MIKTIIKSEPTLRIQDEEFRFLASRVFLRSELRIKNWSDRYTDARLRTFQRSALRYLEHPNYKCLFEIDGTESRISGKRYPTNPGGKRDSWLKSTAKIKNLSVADAVELNKRKQFYIKERIWEPRSFRREAMATEAYIEGRESEHFIATH